MRVIDITNDKKLVLICNPDQSGSAYRLHDGSDVLVSEIYSGYLRQHHYAAAAEAQNAIQGLFLGPFRKADPKLWRQLSKIALNA